MSDTGRHGQDPPGGAAPGQAPGSTPYGGTAPGPPPSSGQGPPAWPGYPPYPGHAAQTNGLAIAALVLAFVFAPAGLVMGIIAKNQIRQTGEDGDGLATAAIVVSAVSLGLAIIAFIAFFAILAVVLTHLPTNTGPSGASGFGLALLHLR